MKTRIAMLVIAATVAALSLVQVGVAERRLAEELQGRRTVRTLWIVRRAAPALVAQATTSVSATVTVAVLSLAAFLAAAYWAAEDAIFAAWHRARVWWVLRRRAKTPAAPSPATTPTPAAP